MTVEMMSLRGLLEKSTRRRSYAEMIGFAAQRLMELEAGGWAALALAIERHLLNKPRGEPRVNDRRCPEAISAALRPASNLRPK